jgi:hypothetical protein
LPEPPGDTDISPSESVPSDETTSFQHQKVEQSEKSTIKIIKNARKTMKKLGILDFFHLIFNQNT